MNHILQVDSVELSFRDRKILSDVYLQCATNEIVGLLGRNGEGKSCLLNVILGNLKATNSFVSFDGVKVTDAFKRPALIRYLPQFNFVPADLKLYQVFEDFRLNYEHFESKFPESKMGSDSRVKQLSGGQRRLLEIYIIAKSNTMFVLMDEPFTHLNPIQIDHVKTFLKEEKINKGIIITDHMYNHILDISDQIYLLAQRKLHLTNKVSDLERLGYVNFSI
jgi:ABC-type lipopolysaccharide export system ATPase subunit